MREIVFDHAGLREMVAELAGVEAQPTSPVIGALRDGHPWGGFLFTGYTMASIQVHMAGADERWCSPTLLQLAFDYPFNQLGVTKVIAPTPSDRAFALAQNLRAGFRLEAVVEDAIPSGHLFILTMRREECKFLGRAIRGFTRGVRSAA